MEILIRVLFVVAFGFMAFRIMRGGGCCGGSHGTHRSHTESQSGKASCCSGKDNNQSNEKHS